MSGLLRLESFYLTSTKPRLQVACPDCQSTHRWRVGSPNIALPCTNRPVELIAPATDALIDLVVVTEEDGVYRGVCNVCDKALTFPDQGRHARRLPCEHKYRGTAYVMALVPRFFAPKLEPVSPEKMTVLDAARATKARQDSGEGFGPGGPPVVTLPPSVDKSLARFAHTAPAVSDESDE